MKFRLRLIGPDQDCDTYDAHVAWKTDFLVRERAAEKTRSMSCSLRSEFELDPRSCLCTHLIGRGDVGRDACYVTYGRAVYATYNI